MQTTQNKRTDSLILYQSLMLWSIGSFKPTQLSFCIPQPQLLPDHSFAHSNTHTLCFSLAERLFLFHCGSCCSRGLRLCFLPQNITTCRLTKCLPGCCRHARMQANCARCLYPPQTRLTAISFMLSWNVFGLVFVGDGDGNRVCGSLRVRGRAFAVHLRGPVDSR